jgi:hypothetical protein
MSAVVFSSSGNFSWTNNTLSNVRVIVNYFGASNSNNAIDYGIQMSVGGAIFRASDATVFGKNLAISYVGTDFNRTTNWPITVVYNNMMTRGSSTQPFSAIGSLPTEVFLAPTQTISISKINGPNSAQYNIVIVPEDG